MVAKTEVGLADVLEVKPETRALGRVRNAGIESYRGGQRQKENMTKTQQRKRHKETKS